eukprot:11164133-Lingulodinium_polyedra.AAC.1
MHRNAAPTRAPCVLLYGASMVRAWSEHGARVVRAFASHSAELKRRDAQAAPKQHPSSAGEFGWHR